MSKALTKSELMKQLERQGDEKVRARYVRDGEVKKASKAKAAPARAKTAARSR